MIRQLMGTHITRAEEMEESDLTATSTQIRRDHYEIRPAPGKTGENPSIE